MDIPNNGWLMIMMMDDFLYTSKMLLICDLSNRLFGGLAGHAIPCVLGRPHAVYGMNSLCWWIDKAKGKRLVQRQKAQ